MCAPFQRERNGANAGDFKHQPVRVRPAQPRLGVQAHANIPGDGGALVPNAVLKSRAANARSCRQPWLFTLIAPLTLLVAMLACSGAPAAMQIVDRPLYVCPTATPRLTDTPLPTSTPPLIVLPPSGWETHTPFPGCIWTGVVCATNTPYPGGSYRTPAYHRPGATATPRPTTTPYPTPTPFVMRPPEEFYVGDPIYTGGFTSPLNVRLRLMNPQTLPAVPVAGRARSIAVWQIEVKNLGATPYDLFPAYQMYVSTVSTPSGEVQGLWGASLEAVADAGLNVVLEAVSLAPAETQTFTLAAYIPSGTPKRFTWALDPTTRATPITPGVPGSNLLIWTNTTNPVCAGELAEPARLPTPIA